MATSPLVRVRWHAAVWGGAVLTLLAFTLWPSGGPARPSTVLADVSVTGNSAVERALVGTEGEPDTTFQAAALPDLVIELIDLDTGATTVFRNQDVTALMSVRGNGLMEVKFRVWTGTEALLAFSLTGDCAETTSIGLNDTGERSIFDPVVMAFRVISSTTPTERGPCYLLRVEASAPTPTPTVIPGPLPDLVVEIKNPETGEITTYRNQDVTAYGGIYARFSIAAPPHIVLYFDLECSRDRALTFTSDTGFQPVPPPVALSYQVVYFAEDPEKFTPMGPCYVFRVVDGPAPTGTPITPTTTPTSTIVPTATITPSPTMTTTPTATATIMVPTAPATSTVVPSFTPVPPGDTTIALTLDPRFPFPGTAAIPDATTYTLDQPPTNGTVVVAPDGRFTYRASTITSAGDHFTVTASGPGGTAIVTVQLTYRIDPSVPTYGEVKSGGSTGSGGNGTRPMPTPGGPDDEGPTEAR